MDPGDGVGETGWVDDCSGFTLFLLNDVDLVFRKNLVTNSVLAEALSTYETSASAEVHNNVFYGLSDEVGTTSMVVYKYGDVDFRNNIIAENSTYLVVQSDFSGDYNLLWGNSADTKL